MTSKKSKQNKEKPESPTQVPKSKLKAVIKDTRWRFALALAASFLLHEPVYHEPVKKAYAEIVTAYHNWKTELEKARLIKISKPEVTEALEADEQAVSEISQERLKRISERAEDAERFKKQILEDPEDIEMDKVFFPLEYYSLGIEEDEMRVAREVFRIKNDSIQVKNPDDPIQSELKEMVDTFMPQGSHNRIRSSAVHTLAQNLGPGTQNCVARARLMAMSAATKYPEFADKLFFQEWGDHIRTLVEVNGKRYILEGPVETFPDKLTDEKRNQVMPLDVWLQIYAGADKEDFKDRIEYHGPSEKSDKENYPRVTDDLIGPVGKPKDLDNVGDADSWFGTGGGGGMPGVSDGGVPGGSGDGEVTEEEKMKGEGISLLNRPHEKRASTEERKPEIDNPYKIVIEDLAITTDTLTKIAESLTGNISEIEFLNLEKLDTNGAKLLADWVEKYRENNKGSMRPYRFNFKLLNQFEPGSASELIRLKGEIIFEGMNSLDEDVAMSFGRFEGSRLGFINLKLLSAEAARGLAGEEFLKPDDLLLPPKPIEGDSLAWFTVEKAQAEKSGPEGCEGAGEGCGGGAAMKQYRPYLTIDGLTGLSQEAGIELGLYNGSMAFKNCNISEIAAEGIAANEHDIHTEKLDTGFYEGLGEHKKGLYVTDRVMSEEKARGIAKHKGRIRLNAKEYEGKALEFIAKSQSENIEITSSYIMHTEALRIMMTYKGDLSIGVNKELTEEDAQLIATHEGELNLVMFQTITPEIAKILTKHKGALLLGDVQFLDPGSAKYFADFEYPLTLGAHEISESVAKILAKKPGDISLHSYNPKSKAMDDIFRNRKGRTNVGRYDPNITK